MTASLISAVRFQVHCSFSRVQGVNACLREFHKVVAKPNDAVCFALVVENGKWAAVYRERSLCAA